MVRTVVWMTQLGTYGVVKARRVIGRSGL